MYIFETLMITGGIFAVLLAAYLVITGSAAGKAQKRRLDKLRFRHSENADIKVESQLKKAIAARKPKAHRVAGSTSRTEALELRLDRTGMGWSLSHYIYASLGVALVVTVLLYLLVVATK